MIGMTSKIILALTPACSRVISCIKSDITFSGKEIRNIYLSGQLSREFKNVFMTDILSLTLNLQLIRVGFATFFEVNNFIWTSEVA